MKRVLFIQNKGNSLGGIWFVNKKICEELSNRGYNVEVLSIRNNPENVFVEDNLNFNVYTINKKNLWEITHKSDLLNSIKKFKFFKTSYMYIKEHFKLLIDYKKAKRYIEKYSPDFIIISHYELLRIVPKKYLSRTIYHHHTSLIESMKNRSLKKTLYKYNNRINFLWLSQNTMKVANNLGLHNNYYI